MIGNQLDKFDTDAGVSPVVGVILMVAVTVILAAVIGTFVLDLGGDVQSNAQAGVTFNEDAGSSVDVQLNSVQNADSVFVQAGGEEAELENVGASVVASTAADTDDLDYTAGDTITVVGELDGERNVIQTYETAE